MRIFYDTENDEFLSLEYLRELYEEYGTEECDSFADFISNCQTINNGTLTDFRNNDGRDYVLRHSGQRFTKEEATAWLVGYFSMRDESDISEEIEKRFNHFDESKVKSDRDF